MMPVLQAQSIRLPEHAGVLMPDVCLRPGDLAWVDASEHDRESVTLWFDVLTGLRTPEAGSVRFAQLCWEQRSLREQDSARGTVRRLDAGSRWISNLDIVENITLAERHHTRRSAPMIHAEAEALARVAGLPALPSGRPADVAGTLLRQCAWVRLLLGHSALLLVDEQFAEPAPESGGALERLIADKRKQGTSILWVGTSRFSGLR